MKSSRNTDPSRRAARAPAPRSAPAVPQARVNRYSHPIRVKSASRRSGTEELLGYILESLTRQGELLEELLRRAGADSDAR